MYNSLRDPGESFSIIEKRTNTRNAFSIISNSAQSLVGKVLLIFPFPLAEREQYQDINDVCLYYGSSHRLEQDCPAPVY